MDMTVRLRTVRMLRAGLIASVGLLLLMLEACATSPDGDLPVQGTFATESSPQKLCVETKCPKPYATCDGVPGLCTTNLRNNVDHCGACDSPCPQPTGKMHGSYVCDEGQCRFACAPYFADCNDSPPGSAINVDGCETSTLDDPQNCGGCGKTCDAGVICWEGACGCPKGFTQCGKTCKRTDSDNQNCGACGNVCTAPPDSDPRWKCGPGFMPANTAWRCGNSACSLQCKPSNADCNQDFCGDGCEVNILRDPKNCGACGHACNDNQKCENGTCLCPEGMTSCYGECVDIATDPNNCGECGVECPGPPSTSGSGSPLCTAGKCSYVCFPGFADCDGRASNGCEANLMTSQLHCGSCDTQCDVAGGQPCVGGSCLTRPCVDPVVK